jgi:hypothetical protein
MSKKQPRLTRQIPPEVRDIIRPYTSVVGEVSWASNYCLNYLNLLYRQLFHKEDINIAVRSWHAMRSDKAQYDLMLAAIAGNRTIHKDIRAEIEWAVNRAIDLAANRNDAVHLSTTVVVYPHKAMKKKLVASDIATLPARYARMSKPKSLAKHFAPVRGDFLQLAAFCYYLWKMLSNGGNDPLPKRPRLRSLPK